VNLFREIIVDNFAGGGGASTGIEMATGRNVDIAINHDPDAIAMHKTNHPNTMHYCESVWEVDPVKAVNGRPVALAWFSPDCKHFSKAKGSTPVNKNIRGLAWVAVKWAAKVRPRVIMLENVEEFKTWGPVVDGKPCPKRKGQTFNSFKTALEKLGYNVEFKELIASEYGAPTIRKRLFMVARRDGQKIVWPKPTHGKPDSLPVKAGKLKAERTAAECIDWSIDCPSIFERARPLAVNTCKRIAKGFQKFVLDTDEPFIVSYYGPKKDGEFRGLRINNPLPTQTTENRFGLVQPFIATPFITEHANASNQRNMPVNEPMRTLCAQVKGGHFAVVAPFIAKHYTGATGSSVTEPVSTVTTIDHNAVVYAHLLKLRNCQYGQSVLRPAPTLTAGGGHVAVVNSWVLKYYGTNIGYPVNEPNHTVTTKERFAVVNVKSIKPPYSDDLLYQAWWCARFLEDYSAQQPTKLLIPESRKRWVNVDGGVLYDIGMRMFQPRELYRAQGFPDNYIIDRDADGNKITKTSQVARCGNAVPPVFAEALVRANLPEMCIGGELYEEQAHRRGMTA
jgi:DNA (cytosine-5)-methyltransferase 1